jgi:hypothetical protein
MAPGATNVDQIQAETVDGIAVVVRNHQSARRASTGRQIFMVRKPGFRLHLLQLLLCLCILGILGSSVRERTSMHVYV